MSRDTMDFDFPDATMPSREHSGSGESAGVQSQPAPSNLRRRKSIFQRSKTFLASLKGGNKEEIPTHLGSNKRKSFFDLFKSVENQNQKEELVPEEENEPAKKATSPEAERLKELTVQIYKKKSGRAIDLVDDDQEEDMFGRSPLPSFRSRPKSLRGPVEDRSSRSLHRTLSRSLKRAGTLLNDPLSPGDRKSLGINLTLGRLKAQKQAKNHLSLSKKNQNLVMARDVPLLFLTNDTKEQKKFYNAEDSKMEVFNATFQSSSKRENHQKSHNKTTQFQEFFKKPEESGNTLYQVYSNPSGSNRISKKQSRKSLRVTLKLQNNEQIQRTCELVIGKGRIFVRFPDKMSQFYAFEISTLESVIYLPKGKMNDKNGTFRTFSLKFLTGMGVVDSDATLFSFSCETIEETETVLSALFAEIYAQSVCCEMAIDMLIEDATLDECLHQDTVTDAGDESIAKMYSRIEGLLKVAVDLKNISRGVYHPESSSLQFKLGEFLRKYGGEKKLIESNFWFDLAQVGETKQSVKTNPYLRAGFDDPDDMVLGLEKFRDLKSDQEAKLKQSVKTKDLNTRAQCMVEWVNFTSTSENTKEQSLNKDDLAGLL